MVVGSDEVLIGLGRQIEASAASAKDGAERLFSQVLEASVLSPYPDSTDFRVTFTIEGCVP